MLRKIALAAPAAALALVPVTGSAAAPAHTAAKATSSPSTGLPQLLTQLQSLLAGQTLTTAQLEQLLPAVQSLGTQQTQLNTLLTQLAGQSGLPTQLQGVVTQLQSLLG